MYGEELGISKTCTKCGKDFKLVNVKCYANNVCELLPFPGPMNPKLHSYCVCLWAAPAPNPPQDSRSKNVHKYLINFPSQPGAGNANSGSLMLKTFINILNTGNWRPNSVSLLKPERAWWYDRALIASSVLNLGKGQHSVLFPKTTRKQTALAASSNICK